MNKEIRVTKAEMPSFEEYIEKIKPLWESHWLTNMGCLHYEFEEKLKDYLEVENVSLMVNGHMTLELVIQAMDFPKGGEVITTPYTFISTTHAIIRNGLKPVFCDIKMSDYTIDEEKIEELITDKTVAILPVHVYGNICNVKRIDEIAKSHNLKVIYDAAHAFGEKLNGVGVGNFGDASCFSFHATKVFNSIEGGAATFKRSKLYEKLYNMKNFGIRSEEIIEAVGANAKMNEFSAAMGICNLKHFEANVEKREKLVRIYLEGFANCDGVKLPEYSENTKYSYGYFPIMFDEKKCGTEFRNKVYEFLKDNSIYARKYFYPITADSECFGDEYKESDLKVARYVGNNILVLPLYSDLEVEDVKRIIQLIIKCVNY